MKNGIGLDEAVDLASQESFPASDAPAWTKTHAGGPAANAVHGPEPLHDTIQRLRDDVRLLGERASVHAAFESAGVPVKDRGGAIEVVLRGGERAADNVAVVALPNAPFGAPILVALAHVLQGGPLKRTVRLVAVSAANGIDSYLEALLDEGPTVSAALVLSGPLPWPRRPSDFAVIGEPAWLDALRHSIETTGLAVNRLRMPHGHHDAFDAKQIAAVTLVTPRGDHAERVGRMVSGLVEAIRAIANDL